MIIDFRLRPPHPLYQKNRITGQQRVQTYSDRMGVQTAPSSAQQSMELLDSEMREAGISIGIMNASYTPRYPGVVPNEAVAGVAQEYPGKLLCLGSISLEWPADKIREETRRCIGELGFVGMSIDPYLWEPAVYVDDSKLEPLYETCMALDVPVVMTLSASSPPDLSYCHPGKVDAVAARHPKLKIVVAHGCWPHVMEMIAVVFRRQNVWISPDMYMMAPGVDQYVQVANSFGRDRFLFATCYPSLPLKTVVDLHHRLPFSEGILEKVFYKNAQALLKL